MAFFKSLKSIGITKEGLVNLTNADVIRIEKLLVAEQKLNDKVSKNDIAQVLEVLTNYPDVVREICSYDCFYGILTGYDAELIDTLRRYDIEQLQRINYVVSNYFIDELTHYLNVNFQVNNINNLRVLFFYNDFFDGGVIRTFTKRLESKFEYAYTVLNDKPWQSTLKHKIRYIGDTEFYQLLLDVDDKHYKPYIEKLLLFVEKNTKYTKNSIFFTKMVKAIFIYNQTFAYPKGFGEGINYVEHVLEWTKSGVVLGFLLYILILFITSNDHNSKPVNTNNKGSVLVEMLPGISNNLLTKMYYFIEERQHTISYPFSNDRQDSLKFNKYDNPFTYKIFASNNKEIQNTKFAINIFNNTANDCITFAYYLDNKSNAKHSTSMEESKIKIYALFVPPSQSISISSQLILLRFYMGNKLSSFNIRKEGGYYEDDPLDMKFNNFNEADSLLLTEGYKLSAVDTLNKLAPTLSITEPTINQYQLSWTGSKPLIRFVQFERDRSNFFIDSITQYKPAILDPIQGTNIYRRLMDKSTKN